MKESDFFLFVLWQENEKLLLRKVHGNPVVYNLHFRTPLFYVSFFSFSLFNSFLSTNMKIIPISVLDDNYSYILIDDKTKEAAVIDPVEPIKILNVISQTGSKLSR